ncbi:MAG: glycoside hydrolase family 92 protein [Actinomycetota bacterium]|nr:glycoside hydrolase family 92 protein [Actinomycetota bacterium]
MSHPVDPFIGSGVTDLPEPSGIAATWWWPKPQVGNTHPGACAPLGMVSACAYSGAYPTGYGLHDKSTEGVPPQMFDQYQASGFTHFQQSGTGAIRKYYNYFRVTPMLDPLDVLDTQWPLLDEVAEPGYYAATLGSGIRCELTVGPKSAVHRYTFPASDDARLVIDFSHGGLGIDYGRTVPLRARLENLAHGAAQGEVTVEGVPLSVYMETSAVDWRQLLWYDRRLMAGGTRLEFDSIRQTTLRPFGLLLRGPTEAGQSIELSLGFSLRGIEQARRNMETDCGRTLHRFDVRRAATAEDWSDHLDRVRVGGGSDERRTVFSTSLYHSLIKPCFAQDESPFWPTSGPFVFDICTMWDIYKTQLPLLTAIAPDRIVEMVNALLQVCQEEGNLPIGYRMARGADRFYRQGSALAHTLIADAAALGLHGIDWDWALVHMHADLRRGYGEDYLEKGVAHPITHTLDLAYGYACTARVARHLGDTALASQLDGLAEAWRNAFDPKTGLLVDSSFYEGGPWNYSFRLMHDMAERITLAGGEEAFTNLLDRFFGFGAAPVKQLGGAPYGDALAEGYALDRFEGLNNEPDMEVPWAYHYVGRPDRTAEVVHAALGNQFGIGRGGLPGNDDSGGLSSWYVWAALGLFPVAGQNTFLVNAPAFEWATLRVGDGELVIETDGFTEPTADGPPQYVQSATLDGRPFDRSHLGGDELHRGGVLRVSLGPEPSDWGTTTRPPSRSTSR